MAKSKFKKFKKPLAKLDGFDAVVSGAAKPALWAGYASAIASVESLADEGKGGKKVKKRKRQALKAIHKLAKHSGGNKAVRAAKAAAEPVEKTKPSEKAKSAEAPAVARLIGTPDAPDNVVPLETAARASAEPTANASEGSRAPGAVDGPLDGKGDALQLITGIGPKLEETLHSLGIWHYEQIAAWGADEIAWVDEHLRFSGRIERENWVAQAAALSRGGREEYLRVFGKEPR